MTEQQTYPLELAIRADEKAKSAHDRLDRMNGSIDRLANQVSATNGKIDAITQALARTDGIEEGVETANKKWLDSRRFALSLIVALSGALIGAVATLIYTHV